MLNTGVALPRHEEAAEAAPWPPENIEVFISEEEIASRVGELAWAIAEDYRHLDLTPEEPLHFVGVSKAWCRS